MITTQMAKEFARDLLGTLKTKGYKNTLRTVRDIANIMNISIDKAIRFIVVAERNGFMCSDNLKTENYISGFTLYKVWEDNITV